MNPKVYYETAIIMYKMGGYSALHQYLESLMGLCVITQNKAEKIEHDICGK